MRGLADEYGFSEQDLVRFFRGERREMERYVIDAQRDAITHAQENRLLEFVEWAGKSLEKPMSYSTIERSFFKEFLFKKALDTAIDLGMEEGTNPRLLERKQLIQLMSMFADVFFVDHWDNWAEGAWRIGLKRTSPNSTFVPGGLRVKRS